MTDKDNQNPIEVHDILAGFSLLTRIPVPVDHTRAGERAHIATWTYSLVGIAIGAVAGLVVLLCNFLLLPSGLTAALAILTMILLTGAMHEDGLADCADGFWGGHSVERRLEIMKDSSIGSYGTLALILFILAEWSALENLIFANPVLTLAAVGAISRVPMIGAMIIMPNARDNGLSAGVGIPPSRSFIIAIIIAVFASVVAFGPIGLAVMTIALIVSVLVIWAANGLIGGQTGDVLGASQKVTELAALAAVLAL